jgi:hypothetical protein
LRIYPLDMTQVGALEQYVLKEETISDDDAMKDDDLRKAMEEPGILQTPDGECTHTELPHYSASLIPFDCWNGTYIAGSPTYADAEFMTVENCKVQKIKDSGLPFCSIIPL